MSENKRMTTDAGRPVGDNQNSLTVGPRGPVIFEDFLLFEKMAHFNRERIPERVVHAKGSGAYGHFVCTNPLTAIHHRKTFFQRWKENSDLPEILNRRRRERLCGYRTGPSRICSEVLHRRRELGPGRK